MNKQVYICTICDKIYTKKPTCEHKCLLINCTDEEYEKYQKTNEIKDRIDKNKRRG